MLSTHEIASIGALGDVTAANLKAIGMNVEVAETDWGTLVAGAPTRTPQIRAAGTSSIPRRAAPACTRR